MTSTLIVIPTTDNSPSPEEQMPESISREERLAMASAWMSAAHHNQNADQKNPTERGQR
jgi:hypothetical protein